MCKCCWRMEWCSVLRSQRPKRPRLACLHCSWCCHEDMTLNVQLHLTYSVASVNHAFTRVIILCSSWSHTLKEWMFYWLYLEIHKIALKIQSWKIKTKAKCRHKWLNVGTNLAAIIYIYRKKKTQERKKIIHAKKQPAAESTACFLIPLACACPL